MLQGPSLPARSTRRSVRSGAGSRGRLRPWEGGELGTVTTYEILLMLDPELAEARQDELVKRVRGLVESGGGSWRSHDAWGRRRLADEIKKKPEGVDHPIGFESPGGTPDEGPRVLKIDEAGLRPLPTRHIEGAP